MRSSSAIAEPPRVTEHAQLGDVAAEEERDRPVGDDAELSGEKRQLVEVVRPRHDPAEEAAQRDAEDERDPFVAAERRDLPERAVAVGPRGPDAGFSRAGAPGAGRAGRSEDPPRRGSRGSARARSHRVPRGPRGPRPAASASTFTRPRSSTGSPSLATSGFGLTPAVQTSVCEGMRSPPARTTKVGPTDSSVVDVLISTPLRASCFAA